MKIRKMCYKSSNIIQSFIIPHLKYSQTMYEEILKLYALDAKAWLDLGCGHHLLPPWRIDEERRLVNSARFVVGLDYDQRSLNHHKTICNRIRGDISNLPFSDNSFDLITSNMVFEHLKQPENQITEVYRCLKPGGILIFHTPNIYGYGTILARIVPEYLKNKVIFLLQQRKEEDVFPVYYRINSTEAIQRIAESCGFHVEDNRLLVSTPLFMLIPPLVLLELLLIKCLMTSRCRRWRTNIIAVMRKPMTEVGPGIRTAV